MSEQELYMISEDRARDEMGATNMLKKHSNMERVVEDYADTIRQLGERSRKFLDDGHPDRCVLIPTGQCNCGDSDHVTAAY